MANFTSGLQWAETAVVNGNVAAGLFRKLTDQCNFPRSQIVSDE